MTGPSIHFELEELRLRLAEAEATLSAIRQGEVDAVLVFAPPGDRVYTLHSADRPYRVLVEAMSQGAATLTREGLVLYANRHLAHMLGTSLENLLGNLLLDHVEVGDRAALYSILDSAVGGQGEFCLLGPAGQLVPALLSLSRLPEADPPMFGLVATDLREQKRQEGIVAAERLSRSILEQASEGIVVFDKAGRILRVSDAAQKLSGTNLLNQPFAQALPLELLNGHQDRQLEAILTDILAGGRVQGLQARLRCADGGDHQFMLSTGPLRDLEGEVIGGVAMLAEITDRVMAEEALRESEARYRGLFDGVPVGLYRRAPEGHLLDANPAMAEMFGFPDRGDLLLANARDLYVDPAARERWEESMRRDDRVRSFEAEMRRRDGTVIWVSDTARAVRDPDGRLRHYEGALEDITERKREAQERLRLAMELESSRRRMVDIVGAVPGVVWEAWGEPDSTGQQINYVSGYVETMLGYTVEEWLATPNFWLTIVHPDDREEAARVGRETFLAGGRPVVNRFRWIAKDGRVVWTESHAVAVLTHAGTPIGLRGVNIDITERQEAEEALAARARQQAMVAELGQAALAGTEIQILFERAVAEVAASFGVEYCKVLELLPDGTALRLVAGIGFQDGLVGRATVGAGLDSQAGYTLLSKEPIIVEDLRAEMRFNGPPLLHDHGVVSGMSVIIGQLTSPFGVLGAHTTRRRAFSQDDANFFQAVANVLAEAIQRKRTEVALYRREQEFRAIVENSPDIIARFNRDLRHVFVNPAIERATGLSPTAFLGKDHYELGMPEELTAFWRKHLGRVFETGEEHAIEFNFLSTDGVHSYHSRIIPEFSPDGTVEFVVGISRDLTEHKRAEEALRESEARYRGLFDGVPVGLYRRAPEGHLLDANPAMVELLGFGGRDELLQANARDLYVDPAARERWEEGMRRDGRVRNFEAEMRRRDGAVIWVSDTARAVRSPDGRLRHYEGALEDITEHKVADVALRESEARYRAVVQNSVEAIYVYDAITLQVLEANPSFLQMTGYDAGEAHGLTVYDIAAHDSQSVDAFVRRVRKEKRLLLGDRQWRRKDGGMLDVSITLRAVQLADREVIVAVARDITQRRQVENELHASREQLRLLLDGVTDGIIATDPDGRVLYANPAAAKFKWYPSQSALAAASAEDILSKFDFFDETRQPILPEHLPGPQVRAGKPHAEAVVGYRDRATGEERWSTIKADPVLGSNGTVQQVITILSDFTERKHAEDSLRFLAEAGMALAETLDLDATLETVARLAVPILGDGCLVDLVEANGHLRRVVTAGADPAKETLGREIVQRFPVRGDSPPMQQVLRTGTSVMIPHVTDEHLAKIARNEEHLVLIRQAGVESLLYLPLIHQDAVLGVITLVMAGSGRHFEPRHLSAAQDLARRAALAFDNARHHQAEQRARETAEWFARRIARLHKIATDLSQALTPAKVAESVMAHVNDALEADAGLMAMLTDSGTELELIGAVGYPPQVLEPFARFPLSSPFTYSEVVRTGTPIWLESREARDERYPQMIAAYPATPFQAWAVIPLAIDVRVIGVMSLGFTEPRDFGTEDREFILSAAYQCAQALERARLFEAEQHARRTAEAASVRLARLQAIAAELASCLEPEQVARVILGKGLSFAGAQGGVLFLYSEAEGLLNAYEVAGYSPEAIAAASPLPGTSNHPLALAARTGQPIWLTSREDWERQFEFSPKVRALSPYHAWAKLPLAPEGRVLGVLGLSYHEPREFSDDDKNLFLALAHQCGQALERARLYESERRTRAAADAAAERMGFLARAGAAMTSSLDLERTLRQVSRLALPDLADFCVVHLIDDDIELRAVAGSHVLPEKQFLLDRLISEYPANLTHPNLLERVLTTGRRAHIPAVRPGLLGMVARDAVELDLFRKIGPRSLVFAPLVRRGQPVGVMHLGITESDRGFDPEDLDLVEELARRAAAAVDNARLFREAREAVALRDQFLSVASHELRTPLTVLQGYAESLLRIVEQAAEAEPDGPTLRVDRARLLRGLGRIHQSNARLASLINNLLDISRIQQRGLPLETERTNLCVLLEGVIDGVHQKQENGRYAGTTVRVALCAIEAAWGHWDPGRIEQVLVNLIDNALKYSPNGGEVTISVTAETDPDGVGLEAHVVVRDQGIGIPPAEQKNVFQLFARASNASSSHFPGMGVGLAISREIVERHGGRLWVESEGEGSGSAFHVTLPLEGQT